MNVATRLLTLSGILMMSAAVSADEMDAVLQWQRSVPLSTPVSGLVVKVNGRVGERVNKGQVLIQLDDRARRARVDALTAALKRAENNRDESGRELERNQELYDRTLIADHDLEMAKIQADDGIAQYEIVKADLVQAKLDLEYSTVSAPFDGWIAQRHVEPGQTVVSELQAEPLMVVVDAHQMVARLQVKGDVLSKLAIGREASVKVDKNTHSGRVSFIGMAPVNGTTDQYLVDIEFNVGKQAYRAGQAARVSF
ncbi:efflux RND transporter periplasmic adaptor subunit [Kaarinaea lacus]